MNGDTINRKEAINAVLRNLNEEKYRSSWESGAVKVMKDTLEKMPTEDRPQGEWIDADGNFVPLDKDGCTTAPAWCSNCGEWLTGSDEYCTSGRFCPSCGARMKGADDE